jgi:hypothetical protein
VDWDVHYFDIVAIAPVSDVYDSEKWTVMFIERKATCGNMYKHNYGDIIEVFVVSDDYDEIENEEAIQFAKMMTI